VPQEIEIHSTFRSHGYDGMLIRTEFRKLNMRNVLICEGITSCLSIGVTTALFIKWTAARNTVRT
jgi:hypothetical protein